VYLPLSLLQATLDEEIDERDWGVQQVLTSANWGGVVGNFFTGGLNLQVRDSENVVGCSCTLPSVCMRHRSLHVSIMLNGSCCAVTLRRWL
jgi:hypothetical protein